MRDGDDVAVGEEQVLALLEQRNGQVVKLAIYREPGLPPVLSLWLHHRTVDGTLLRDGHRGFRFFPDEWGQLAHGLLRALEEMARLSKEGG